MAWISLSGTQCKVPSSIQESRNPVRMLFRILPTSLVELDGSFRQVRSVGRDAGVRHGRLPGPDQAELITLDIWNTKT